MKGLVYASVDIEADGQNPMRNNMRSIGIVFTDETGKILHEYLGDIKPLKGHEPDPATMEEFWSKHQDELARINKNSRPYQEVMLEIFELVNIRFKDHKVEWIAAPAAYDWAWVSAYAHLYLEEADFKPLPHKAKCISTVRGLYWDLHPNLTRKQLNERITEWTKGTKLTHCAVDDARYQAAMFHALMRELKRFSK